MIGLAARALAGLLVATTPALSAPFTSVFGTLEFGARSHAALPQWQRALAAIESEDDIYTACSQNPADCPNRAAMAWEAHLKSLAGLDETDQLRRLNRFINKWPRRSDQENFGEADHWATPLEFLHRSGDAEDFAIAKYVSLRRLGWPAERLRMVIVRDRLRNRNHAVLAVSMEDGVVILDTLSDATMTQERFAQYEPYFSVNEFARWAHAPRKRTLTPAGIGR